MTLIILGKDITEKQITDFNQTWNTAFDKDKVILDKATINPADKIFFEYDHDILVAVARLRKISPIYVGEVGYQEEVWGLCDVSVCGTKGRGYGKKLVLHIVDYCKDNGTKSLIGLHGKDTTLDNFYTKCRMLINEDIPKRMTRIKNNETLTLGHCNISYLPKDPFVEFVKNSKGVIKVPHSW